MPRIQPRTLTDEELLRLIYIEGFDKVPVEYVKELCARFARLLDATEPD